jgi:cob(I)alamin adenosyltransferase
VSITTKTGDRGQTAFDEPISAMGFARAICPDPELRALTKELQRELFKVGPAAATQRMTDYLTDEVQRLEEINGVLGDWAIPGEDPCSAACINRLFGRVVEVRLGKDATLRTTAGARWLRAW